MVPPARRPRGWGLTFADPFAKGTPAGHEVYRVEGASGENKSDGGENPGQLEAGLAGGSLAVCPGHAVRPSHMPELAGWPNQPSVEYSWTGVGRWAGICAKRLVATHPPPVTVVHVVRAIPEYNHELFCPHSKRRGPSAISVLCIHPEGAWPAHGPAKRFCLCSASTERPAAGTAGGRKHLLRTMRGEPGERERGRRRSHNPHAAVASAHGNTQVHGSRT